MFKNWLMKKLTGHKKFYHDEATGFSFYGKLGAFYDISVIIYNHESKSIRQYMVDYATLFAINNLVEGEPITPIERMLQLKTVPALVNKYVDKQHMHLIRTVNSKIVKTAVVAKIDIYGEGENTGQAISFKRIAWAGRSNILAIDTMALPEEGARAFMKFIKKMFKGVDLELELNPNKEEKKDGDN
jgi:hypothetical protein